MSNSHYVMFNPVLSILHEPASPEKGCLSSTQETSWRASAQGMLAVLFDVADSPYMQVALGV